MRLNKNIFIVFLLLSVFAVGTLNFVDPVEAATWIKFDSGTYTTTTGRITGYYTNLPQLSIYTPISSSSGLSSSYSSSSSSSNKDLPDLRISKVSKKGNTHTAFIKNIDKKNTPKRVLGIYDGKKLIKKVNVKAIGKGKTVQVKVTLAKKFKIKLRLLKLIIITK